MRHFLPLCALIVFASGCVVTRQAYDESLLPPITADHTEIISDKTNPDNASTPTPSEERVIDISDDHASDVATEKPRPEKLSTPDSAPVNKKHNGPYLALKTFADGGRFDGGATHLIEWECLGFAGVNAELFVEFYDGRGWRCLWRGEPADTQFKWQLPNIDSVYCKIRVRVKDGAVSLAAASQSFFIIESTKIEQTMSIEIDDEQSSSDDVAVVEPTVKQFAPKQEPESSKKSLLLLQANDHLSRGEYENACRVFVNCLEIDPADVATLYGLGQAHYYCARLAQAREILLRAIALQDDHADAQYALGRVVMKLAPTAADPASERLAAKKYFLKAIQINPKYDAAYNDLGKVCFDSGEIENAYGYFEKAVECDGENKIYLYNAGRAAYALKNLEACVQYCLRAISADAEFRYPYWLVAKSYSELEKWDEAVLYWTTTAKLFSSDEKLHAEALHELQQAREALAGDAE